MDQADGHETSDSPDVPGGACMSLSAANCFGTLGFGLKYLKLINTVNRQNICACLRMLWQMFELRGSSPDLGMNQPQSRPTGMMMKMSARLVRSG